MPGADFDGNWAHICVDMQRVFAEDTDWHAPWLDRVLPVVSEIAGRSASRTIFTRFLPPASLDEASGAWRLYYQHWRNMLGERIDPALLDLVPPLARLVPPAKVLDKQSYSPWWSGELHRALRRTEVDTLVITGGESDVCVLATLLGAIDLGYRVVVPSDAIFGSADQTHDAILDIYRSRFQFQLTITNAADLLERWRERGL